VSSAPIAVTGATGFLGGAIARRLAAQGRPLRLLVRDPARAPAIPGAELAVGGLESPQALEALVAGAFGVVHCAGLVKARSRGEFFAVNAHAAGSLAQAAARAGVERFVLISSLAARAPHLSAYAASKAAGEAEVRAVSGLKSVLLRPPGIYGPGDREAARLLALANRGWLPAPGPRSSVVALIHVEDAAAAAVAALDAPQCAGGMYEIDDGAGGYTWAGLAQVLSDALQRRVRPAPIPAPVVFGLAYLSAAGQLLGGRADVFGPGKARELRHADWRCDSTPLQRDAGWRPLIPLLDGLRETCSWLRSRQ
jgi:nucleoside-diphosphate-sugar epimerase